MKYLFLFAGLWFPFINTAHAQRADAGQVLNQIYGTITACTRDADADLFTTTVNADSASGQKVLKTTATTDFVAGDILVVNPGGAREEACTIDTVQAGTSATCLANLTYTHTAVQGDAVDISNRLGPFTDGGRYEVYCHNGSGTLSACRMLQGGVAADAEYASTPGLQLFTTTMPKTITFRSPNLYLSTFPAADNAYVEVCPRR